MDQRLNEFTAREDRGSGTVARVVRRRGLKSAYTSPELVILIHGFNVPQERAAESLEGFWRRLRSSLGSRGRKLPPAFAFYWPGSHENWALSAATFTARIGVADDAGKLLGTLLTKLRPSQRVILIGHSLGCRVLLQALTHVADQKAACHTESAEVPVACLLAAAVPVGRCVDGERFSSAVIKNNVEALHSRSDRVLQFFFAPGQHLFERDKAEAVGRNGGPPRRWGPRHDMGLGHGHYLTSDRAADEVARIIDPRLSWAIGSWYLPGEELPEARKLARRDVPSRSINDDLEAGWVNCWPIAGDGAAGTVL